MASAKKTLCRILETALYKYPLINALTLLMLFAERASNESEPPIHPKIVYANLLGFLACGLLLSSHVKQKEAALVFCGQLIYFAYNFYNNNKLHYKEWLRTQMCVRQIGCVGVYLMFASILDKKKSSHIRRTAEIVLGLYLFAYVYLINNTKEVRNATLSHILAGDWGRYMFTVVLAACALSFFSGYFLRDMSLCAAVTIVLLTVLVDCDFSYWSRKGVHFWNQARMVGDNLCVCTGLFYAFFHIDNRVKMD
ncbi:transmembrane protein 101-like [Elysia marginata]|uniref:Transmembrane protein 101-like n=2 Tax=Elysia marginata TaxID=1093978 RepID=A0AAV4ITT1_9GAST|nr:transmembrane protein 101-like [Elysia marginata]